MMHKGRSKYMVFDFDGVLADSFEVFLDALINVQPKYFESKSKSELINISKNIGIDTLNVEREHFKKFTQDLRDFHIKGHERINLFKGAGNIVAEIKRRNINIGIVSFNDTNLIKRVLKRFNLDESFEFIIGDIKFNGKDRALTDLSQQGVDLENSWYIGDTPHDIKSAKSANMKSVAACWGYSSKNLLLKEFPEHCLVEISQIPKLVSTSNSSSPVF